MQFSRRFSIAATNRLFYLPDAPVYTTRRNYVHNSQILTRWRSNGSVNNMPYPIRIPTTLDLPQEPKAPRPPPSEPKPKQFKDYKKSKRKNSSTSGLSQLATSHPKSTIPITHAPLTRKQLLRLTAKQRANIKTYQIEQHKASRSYLEQARSNVRSNIKFIKGTAESNLKKNIGFFKKLWKGEDVWKDETKIKDATKDTSEKEPIHWERLPSAIQLNVQSNIATLQNYLHKFTDGAIPSPHLSTGTGISSIAIRLQKFNEAKKNQGLKMDNKWMAKNIALALLPGAMVGIYCKSKEEEMKKYYEGMEKREREKIFGASAATGSDVAASKDGEASGMGLSFALITEGGSVFDKVKMAVNDLFLGGMDEKIKMAKEAGDAGSDESVASENSNQATAEDVCIPDREADRTIPKDDKDTTIETLLLRIQALEKQVGMNSNIESSPAENQSPIQKRREERLKGQWRKGEEEKKQPTESNGSLSLPSLIEIVVEWAKGMVLELFPRSLRVVVKQPESQASPDENAADTHHKLVIKPIDETQPKDQIVDVKETAISADTASKGLAVVQNDTINNQSEDPAATLSETENNESHGRLSRWWSRIRIRKRKEEQMSEDFNKCTK